MPLKWMQIQQSFLYNGSIQYSVKRIECRSALKFSDNGMTLVLLCVTVSENYSNLIAFSALKYLHLRNSLFTWCENFNETYFQPYFSKIIFYIFYLYSLHSFSCYLQFAVRICILSLCKICAHNSAYEINTKMSLSQLIICLWRYFWDSCIYNEDVIVKFHAEIRIVDD